MQAQQQHYEESLGKMEVLYPLLQPGVEKDMEGFCAKHGRQIAQQTQAL